MTITYRLKAMPFLVRADAVADWHSIKIIYKQSSGYLTAWVGVESQDAYVWRAPFRPF
jgi:hypothetical protein